MISRKVVALCAAFGVALTGASIAVPATAEPVANTFAIVGSDTIEDALNGLVNGSVGSSVRTFAKGSTMGSFDATGSPCIVTKAFGARFGRPNGSSDGVLALSRSIDGGTYTSKTTTCPDNNARVITGYVDIARSSSGKTANAAGELLYIPFGRDAFAYAYHKDSTAAGINTLTKAQLISFFDCTVRTLDGKTITPVVPQAGSGTRTDWVSKLGLTETTLVTVGEGGCVVEGQEHDGNSLTVINSVMPMGASKWVAYSTGMTASKIGNGILAGIQDTGFTEAPVTGTGADMVPNSAYYANSTWGRDTYIVVEYARVNPTDPKYDPDLAAAVDPTISDSLANTSSLLPSRAGFVKKKYGLLAPASSTTFRAAKS